MTRSGRYLTLCRVVAFLLLAPALATAAERLNIFIYSEYLPRDVIAEFERKFRCEVVVDLYEDAEGMLAKVQAGGTALYDIVVPTDYVVTAMVKQNLLAPLRHEQIPNLKNLDPKFLNPPYDPGNRFTAAYQWGTVGIYLRTKPGETVQESWSLLFDPARSAGAVSLSDSMRDSIGAALQHLGYSPNSVTPGELKKARDLLVRTKQRAASFAASVGGKNQVLDGSVRAAMVYSGEAGRGMAEDPATTYVIPREGSMIWVDSLAILARAPHRALAEQFINFVLEPEIGARISNAFRFSTPNARARPLIDPALLRNPALYPPEETVQRLEFLRDLGANTRLYDQIWTAVKSD